MKTRPTPLPAVSGPAAGAQGVTFQAQALTDEDYLYATFDANLVMAGILPVMVKVENSATAPVNLKKLRFEVISSGKPFRVMEARRAYSRLVSFYGISVYTREGNRRSREDFTSYALPLEPALSPGETRQGIMFFPVPDALIEQGGLTFVASKLKVGSSKQEGSVQLKLD